MTPQAVRPDWERRFTVVANVLFCATLALIAAGVVWGTPWMVAALVTTCVMVVSVTLSAIAGILARGNKEIEQATEGIGGQR
jgi:ATP/ADP translocase